MSPNQIIRDEIKIIIAAEEVDIIDGYAESLSINKFDLSIDWGWFYFYETSILYCRLFL